MLFSTSVTDTLMKECVKLTKTRFWSFFIKKYIFAINLYHCCFNLATIVGALMPKENGPHPPPPNNPQSLILYLSKVNICSYQPSQPIFRRSALHQNCKKRWCLQTQTIILIIIDPIRLTIHRRNNQWLFIVGFHAYSSSSTASSTQERAQEGRWHWQE